MSLMCVSDRVRQIQECYRLLKKGSFACFTVWGRPENSICHTVIDKALSGGFGVPLHSYFNVSSELPSVKQEFVEAGFDSGVKTWFQATNWWFKDGQDFAHRYFQQHPFSKGVKQADVEKVAQVYDE